MSFSWCASFLISQLGQFNAHISQAAKDVRAQDTLVGVCERIESFFQRLEIYTDVSPTTQMMNTMIRIMSEVLSILGIMTKEIEQYRISE